MIFLRIGPKEHQSMEGILRFWVGSWVNLIIGTRSSAPKRSFTKVFNMANRRSHPCVGSKYYHMFLMKVIIWLIICKRSNLVRSGSIELINHPKSLVFSFFSTTKITYPKARVHTSVISTHTTSLFF